MCTVCTLMKMLTFVDGPLSFSANGLSFHLAGSPYFTISFKSCHIAKIKHLSIDLASNILVFGHSS